MIIRLTTDLLSMRITFEAKYPMRLIASGESELDASEYYNDRILREAGLLRQFKKIEAQESSWLILSGMPTPDIGNHVMDDESKSDLEEATSGKSNSLLRLHCPEDSDLNFVYLWLAEENFRLLVQASLSAMGPQLRLVVSFVYSEAPQIAALARGQTVYCAGPTVQIRNKNAD